MVTMQMKQCLSNQQLETILCVTHRKCSLIGHLLPQWVHGTTLKYKVRKQRNCVINFSQHFFLLAFLSSSVFNFNRHFLLLSLPEGSCVVLGVWEMWSLFCVLDLCYGLLPCVFKRALYYLYRCLSHLKQLIWILYLIFGPLVGQKKISHLLSFFTIIWYLVDETINWFN